MKSYTDLPQSKKLAEILPPESADMRYGYIAPYEFSDRMYEGGYDNVPYPKDFLEKNPNFSENDYDDSLPCWSLAALLNILDFPALTQEDENEWEVYVPDYNTDEYIEIKADNPIDACVAMIEKLHEQNLL